MTEFLAVLGGLLSAVVLFGIVISAVVYLAYRSKKERDETSRTGGVTERIKQTIRDCPPWIVAASATAGGWLFLLFAVYVLLPGVSRWLSAHPTLLWMPPLCLAAASLLYSKKKWGNQTLAWLVILVLAVGVWQTFTGRSDGNADEESRSVKREPAILVLAPARFDNCVALPANDSKKKDTATLYAPVGAESVCYLIRDGYWFRISPKNDVRIRWQHGLVQNLNFKRVGFIPLGDSIRNAAFTLMSLEGTPASVVVRLEKKS